MVLLGCKVCWSIFWFGWCRRPPPDGAKCKECGSTISTPLLNSPEVPK